MLFSGVFCPRNAQSLASSNAVAVAPHWISGGLVIASADSLVRLGPLCSTGIMHFYNMVINRRACCLGACPAFSTSACHKDFLATASLRVTEGGSCVERFKPGNLHANINYARLWISLTKTCSESVGPPTRLWWVVACSCGHVCYMHWAHVYPRLHCQAPQVRYPVSDLHLFVRPPASRCGPCLPAVQIRNRIRQMESCIASTADRHGYANSCNPSTWFIDALHLLTADSPPARRFRLPYDMSRLVTGRSALDPLQRSCGTKVRRVAACRWILRQTSSTQM